MQNDARNPYCIDTAVLRHLRAVRDAAGWHDSCFLFREGQVDRMEELIACEQRLRTILRSWKFLPGFGASRATARLEIAGLLSEAQMVAERQLAETAASRRELERYRLEIAVPTIIAMKGWYCLYYDD